MKPTDCHFLGLNTYIYIYIYKYFYIFFLFIYLHSIIVKHSIETVIDQVIFSFKSKQNKTKN